MTATEGAAIYFDGATARRREVELGLTDAGLAIVDGADVVACWAWVDLRRRDAPAGLTRVGSVGAPELARLDIDDAALAAAVVARAPSFDVADRAGRGFRTKIVVGSLAVAVSLVLTTLFLVPLVADRLAPLIPLAWEVRLGDAVDKQVQAVVGSGVCQQPAGLAALRHLSARLGDAADLGVPIEIAVLRTPMANAIALPGGRIYLFEGLLKLAKNPDEVAGVLAHEIGHVRARDGLRKVIQNGGSAFLLGLLFGDVTGASTVVFVGRTLVDTSYTRDAERAADAESGRIMTALGRPAAAMPEFLLRLTKDKPGLPFSLLQSHPRTEERLEALTRLDRPATGRPLLDDAQWKALQGICDETK